MDKIEEKVRDVLCKVDYYIKRMRRVSLKDVDVSLTFFSQSFNNKGLISIEKIQVTKNDFEYSHFNLPSNIEFYEQGGLKKISWISGGVKINKNLVIKCIGFEESFGEINNIVYLYNDDIYVANNIKEMEIAEFEEELLNTMPKNNRFGKIVKF